MPYLQRGLRDMERLGHSFIVECVLSTQEAQGSISGTKAKSEEEHETDLKKTISPRPEPATGYSPTQKCPPAKCKGADAGRARQEAFRCTGFMKAWKYHPTPTRARGHCLPWLPAQGIAKNRCPLLQAPPPLEWISICRFGYKVWLLNIC